MTDTADQNAMNKTLFAELIMMLSTSAMQQMGKLISPITHKAEVNLEAAQVTIDLLDMLKARTKGNLDHDEDAMLTGVLSSLQMTYVETIRKQPPAGEKKSAAGPSESAPATESTPPGDASDAEAKVPPKDPKYHKAYG